MKTEDYQIGDLIRNCDGDFGVIVSFLSFGDIRVFFGSRARAVNRRGGRSVAGFYRIGVPSAKLVCSRKPQTSSTIRSKDQ